jgi:branched-chain amino acid transport system substrate-binding protein
MKRLVWPFVRRSPLIALAVLAVTACDRSPDAPPVVGIGIAGSAMVLQQLAQRAGGLSTAIDSSGMGDGNVQSEVSRAQQLAATPGLVGVVGHSSSRSTLAVAPVYAEVGIPMIVPSATSRLLGSLPNAFLLAPSDSTEAAYMARFVRDSLQARRAWVLFLNDAYGIGLRDGLRLALPAAGVRIVAEQSHGELSDYALLLDAQAGREAPDVILLAGRVADTEAIVNALATRHPGVPVVAADGAGGGHEQIASLFRTTTPVYITTFWWPDAARAADTAFVAEWRALTGTPPGPSDALQRDAIHLLAAAIRDGQTTRARVTAWLTSLGRTRPPFDGLTGPIAFTPGTRARFVMVQPTADSIRVVAR